MDNSVFLGSLKRLTIAEELSFASMVVSLAELAPGIGAVVNSADVDIRMHGPHKRLNDIQHLLFNVQPTMTHNCSAA